MWFLLILLLVGSAQAARVPELIPSGTDNVICTPGRPGRIQMLPDGTLQLCDESGGLHIIPPTDVTIPPDPTPSCGNHRIDEGEDCDPPGTTCTLSQICSDTCVCPQPSVTCGNGVVETGEECDGAGLCAGATCCTGGPTCVNCTCVQPPQPTPECLNGTIEPGETCDPGGKACTLQTDCGTFGNCSDSVCAGDNGPCAAGCANDCSCNPVTEACTGDIYVATTGDDTTGDGSSGSPYKTVGKAASLVSAGQTVCIASGVYNERVTLPATDFATTVTFKGVSGAIIDGADYTKNSGWTQTSNSVVPNANGNVWQKSLGYTPAHMTWNDAYIVEQNNEVRTPWKNAIVNGPLVDPSASGRSNPTYTWTDADALFHSTGGVTYLSFYDGRSPNGQNISFCPANTGTFNTGGAKRVTVTGLTIKGCENAVRVPGGQLINIKNNILLHGRRTVHCIGCSSCIFEQNQLSLNYGRDMSASNPRHWAIWQVFRSNGINPRMSFDIGGAGSSYNTVRDNLLTQIFDGISDWDGSSLDSSGYDNNQAFKVYNNTLIGVSNDGIMLREGGVLADVHDNTILDTNYGFRVRVYQGPTYVYRNKVYTVEGAGFFLEGGFMYMWHGFPGRLYVYHNSMGGQRGIVFGSASGNPAGEDAADGIPNTYFINNLFNTPDPAYFYSGDWNLPESGKAYWKYNWHLDSSGFQASWMDSTNVRCSTTGSTVSGTRLWAANQVCSFLLPETGPASCSPRDEGIPVSTTDATTGRPYFGFTSGYEGEDNAPDIGAVQFQSPGTTTTTSTSTTTSSTVTSGTLPDWAPFLDCVYDLDETTAVDRASTGGETCGALTRNTTGDGAISEEISIKDVGAAATGLASGTGTAYLATSNAETSVLGYSGSFIVGCSARATGAHTTSVLISKTDNSTVGYKFERGNTNSNAFFSTYNNAESTNKKTGCNLAANSWPLNTWVSFAGILDDDNNVSQIYKNGNKADCSSCQTGDTLSGGSCTRATLDVSPSTVAWEIGSRSGAGNSSNFDGQVDECFADTGWSETSGSDGIVDPYSYCQLVSCGIHGTLCTCNGSSWLDVGRNATRGGGCTLPTDCAQAQP